MPLCVNATKAQRLHAYSCVSTCMRQTAVRLKLFNSSVPHNPSETEEPCVERLTEGLLLSENTTTKDSRLDGGKAVTRGHYSGVNQR